MYQRWSPPKEHQHLHQEVHVPAPCKQSKAHQTLQAVKNASQQHICVLFPNYFLSFVPISKWLENINPHTQTLTDVTEVWSLHRRGNRQSPVGWTYGSGNVLWDAYSVTEKHFRESTMNLKVSMKDTWHATACLLPGKTQPVQTS